MKLTTKTEVVITAVEIQIGINIPRQSDETLPLVRIKTKYKSGRVSRKIFKYQIFEIENLNVSNK